MPIAPDGGFALAVARFCAATGLLSAFGSLLFRSAVLPKVLARNPDAAPVDHSIRVLARGSLAAALAGLIAWGALQTAEFAHSGLDLKLVASAWPVVLFHTVFGHLWLAQVVMVVIAGLLAPRFGPVALAFSGVALLLQAGHSHAASMYDGPSVLLGSDVVHLAAAGGWLGGLVPLLLVVRTASPRAGAAAARWFSPLGKVCVAGLVGSAAFQFWALVNGLPGLVGTAYGWVAAIKIALLGVLFGFALLNRYWLAPALLRADLEAARRSLLRSVAVQTGFGLATVLAASMLSNLPPALHEQPVWPFAWRPSLEVMVEPDLAAEIWQGALLAAGAAILLLSLAWSRLRRIARAAPILLAAAALGWFAWPHLSLLLVEAYPTSYYRSPTNFAATSIVQGAALYPANCAGCHGVGGQGNSQAADLTAGHLWAHSDGELFWWLSHGIDAPDGTLAMPGFAPALSQDQRWALIDAIRARNAGDAFRETGTWPVPVQLPAFSLVCPTTGDATTDDLRGRVVYIVIQDPGSAPAAPVANATAVVLGATRAATVCTASEAADRGAIAILLGQPQESLAGARVLVDANGWLRAAKMGEDAALWDDPAALSAAIGAITTPLSAASGAHRHQGG